MKKLLLLLALTFVATGHSQLSFSKTHIGPPSDFKKGIRERFKETTTVFVVPSTYTKEQYESILKDNWTASKYKIVSANEFNIKDYLTDAYSFAWLQCDVVSDHNVFYMDAYYDIFMLENEKMLKKIDKAITDESKLLDLIDDNKINFVHIPIQLSNKSFEMVKDKLNPTVRLIFKGPSLEKKKAVFNEILASKGLNNFELGFLKNDFQRANKVINEGKTYWMYGNDKTPKVKDLKKETLLIPDYIQSEYKSLSGKENIRTQAEVSELLSKYKSKFEIVSQNDISKKILAGDDFYYFRYSRIIASKFIEIVNGKTGEVVYRSYAGFAAYNLKDKDFENIK